MNATATTKKRVLKSELPPVDPERLAYPFVALFPNRWGQGDSIEEALARARSFGGKGRQYMVYAMPQGVTKTYVDDMGGIRWVPGPTTPDAAQPELVLSHGIKTVRR